MTELRKTQLLERLPPIPRDESTGVEEIDLRQLSLRAGLLMLAEINHEHEYELCREVARHCLGEAYEPEDIAPEDIPGR